MDTKPCEKASSESSEIESEDVDIQSESEEMESLQSDEEVFTKVESRRGEKSKRKRFNFGYVIGPK